MPLKLELGSVFSPEVDAQGDLAKFLNPGITSLITLGPAIMNLLDGPVSNVPEGSVSTDFKFNFAPSWTITQTVGITLTVKPEASCTLAIVKPGDTVFTYLLGENGKEVPVKAGPNQYYIAIALKCSLAVEAGAQFSAGNFGVSGSVSNSDEFRIANYFAIENPSLPLRDCIAQAFSSFVLPFHAASIQKAAAGNYVDFEFNGALALGFGATYGLSGLFLAGRSNGEVSKSFDTRIGKLTVNAAPSFQVAAEFKVQYTHTDTFRIVAARTASGATLYLMRKGSNGIATSEGLHLTLNAGAKFQMDSSTLKAEATAAVGNALPAALSARLPGVVDQALGAVNNGINGLLKRGDGLKIDLELTQSKVHENTALFIYDFDFSHGIDAYDVAMRGDYAKAVTMEGVSLDPRSFIEQAYISSAGLNLQLFDLLKFHDITEYVQKTAISYLGNRTFQIRQTEGVKAISGLFGKEREADLYFIAQCNRVVDSTALSAVSVRMQAVFNDIDNKDAFRESQHMMTALALTPAATAIGARIAALPKSAVQITLDADAMQLAAVESDDVVNDKIPQEPHQKDKRNYEQFVAALAEVIGLGDSVSTTFVQSFGRYEDWLEYNRVVTDQEGSTKPGDRLNVGSRNSAANWPANFPPSDLGLRNAVQTYILAAQAFMNFCDAVKHLAASLPDADTESKFDQIAEAIHEMVRHQVPYPTYFLKPSMVALMRLAGVQLAIDSAVPDPSVEADFSIAIKPAAALAVGLP